MAHLPDERFKHTIYDLEDCLDSITDFDPNYDIIKESEKKKAAKMFEMFLDFCMDEAIITAYDLSPLYCKLGLEMKIKGQVVEPPTLAAHHT